jgi:hypothetical protein
MSATGRALNCGQQDLGLGDTQQRGIDDRPVHRSGHQWKSFGMTKSAR